MLIGTIYLSEVNFRDVSRSTLEDIYKSISEKKYRTLEENKIISREDLNFFFVLMSKLKKLLLTVTKVKNIDIIKDDF